MAADKHTYSGIVEYRIREYIARGKDFFYVNVLKPKPKSLGKIIPVDVFNVLIEEVLGMNFVLMLNIFSLFWKR